MNIVDAEKFSNNNVTTVKSTFTKLNKQQINRTPMMQTEVIRWL